MWRINSTKELHAIIQVLVASLALKHNETQFFKNSSTEQRPKNHLQNPRIDCSLWDAASYRLLKMCYHKLYIFSVCGHPKWGPRVTACNSLSLPQPTDSHPGPQIACPMRLHHPFLALKLHSLCLECQRERDRSLTALRSQGPGSLQAHGTKPQHLGELRMDLKRTLGRAGGEDELRND